MICTFLYRTLSLLLLSRFPSALPLFPSTVPSPPYPTTPVSGDRAPIRDSRPRHSRGHEACLSPPYVIHSLLLLTQSRLTRDQVSAIVLDSVPLTCTPGIAHCDTKSRLTGQEILPYFGSSRITIRSSDLLGNLRTFHLWLRSSDRIPSDLPRIILGSIRLVLYIGDRTFFGDSSYQ